ncbi:hypothetical protein BDV28DRAFT_157201 [Aspergillus coremiiformis]|uniref:Uncharacterized protein n=1 Tax=Aspergillus coremiiformis TaxID=138285 RepID=A0A5N6Z7Q0_9EURO|nr:hypothetical protein BDV28DRAFT_157201 [Aspergillus coremiiformis]
MVGPLILLKGCSSTVKSGLVKRASADIVDPFLPVPYATIPPVQNQKSIPSLDARLRPNPLQKYNRGAARVSSRSNSLLVPIAPRPSNSPPTVSGPRENHVQARTVMMLQPNAREPVVSQQQLFQPEQSFVRENVSLPFTCGSFAAPALCTMVDVPGSMPMVSALESDPSARLFFGDATFVDGGFALEDLDVGALETGVLQEDWSWLSEDAL